MNVTSGLVKYSYVWNIMSHFSKKKCILIKLTFPLKQESKLSTDATYNISLLLKYIICSMLYDIYPLAHMVLQVYSYANTCIGSRTNEE